jgi:hypothetical protein
MKKKDGKKMTRPKLTLLRSLRVIFSRLFSGRIHFLKEYAGKILLMEDGKKFQVIRNLKVDPTQKSDKYEIIPDTVLSHYIKRQE